MNAPTNVLVADLQNGCQALVKWTPPTGTPQGYYVHVASTETGTYVKRNVSLITDSRFIIPNLSLAEEIFVKVSAVDESDVETALSSVGDDAQIAAQPAVELLAEARLGSVIAAGAYFSARVAAGVATLQVTSEFTFDGSMMLWELDANNYVEFQTDVTVFVLGGETVAELRQEGWYLAGRKIVLNTLGAVVDATEAPYEWSAGEGTLYAIHETPTDIRLMGIDVSGNMYLGEHDSQPYQLPGSGIFGLQESGDELIWGNGYYQLSSIDRDEKLFFVRGRIIENVSF